MNKAMKEETIARIRYLTTLLENNKSVYRGNSYFLAGIVEASEFFNTEFYTEKYPDVLDSGLDPILHYIFFGFREGRTPGKWCWSGEWEKMVEEIEDINKIDFTTFLVKINEFAAI